MYEKRCLQSGKLTNLHYDYYSRIYSPDYLAPTITRFTDGGVELKIDMRGEEKKSDVRRLTPKEYWRLMGFSDDDFNAARSAGLSNRQLYKQAGNSIVVNVLEAVFGELNENNYL